MTHDARENAIDSGAPVVLMQFAQGATNYLLTNAPISITHNSLTYDPAPVTHDKIRISGSLDGSTLQVNLPQNAPVAQLFLVYPPSEPVTLKIRNGHIGETDFPVIWTGRVLNADWRPPEVILACEPITTAMRRSTLLRRWQPACPYALFNGLCKASKAAATSAVAADAVSDSTITLPAGWDAPHGHEKYRSGTAGWTNNVTGAPEFRSIRRTTATTIVVNGLASGLAATETVNVVLGCNKTLSDCGSVHNVANDFGGQPGLARGDNIYQKNIFY